MAAPSDVNLNEEQLKKLAKIIYCKEVDAIKEINFESEYELANYLKDCKSGYNYVLSILKDGGEVKMEFKDHPTKASIAHDMYSYLLKALNISLKSVRSFAMRLTYLKKVSEHSMGIFRDLRMLDATNVINVARLAKEAFTYNKIILEYNKKFQGISTKVFSRLTEHGYTFKELVHRYQTKLNFPGLFKDLEDAQKLQVYNKIIEASGMGSVKMTAFEVTLGVIGAAVLLFTAGMIVWDIYTSDHKIKTAAEDALMIIAPIGGTMIGAYIATTLVIRFVSLSSTALSCTGFVVGIIAGKIISSICDLLIDWIFSAGGSDEAAPPSTVFMTDGHRCYVAKMPDPQVLARQIAHQK